MLPLLHGVPSAADVLMAHLTPPLTVSEVRVELNYRSEKRNYAYYHQSSSLQLVFLWSFFSKKGTKAPQAAGKIHTDFEKGFIMAEVMKYEDFKEEGSENAVKVRNYFLHSCFTIHALE